MIAKTELEHLVREQASEVLAELGSRERALDLPETLWEGASLYIELLQRWTKKIDLVADASAPVLVERHLGDSLAALLRLRQVGLGSGALLDVGSGAGLPGVIAALLEPDRQVVLCEPREKRVMFLKEVKRSLSLSRLEVVRAKLQDLSRKALPPISTTIARALGLDMLFLDCSAELAPQGKAALMLGPGWQLRDLPAPTQLLDYRIYRDGPSRKLAVWSLR